MKPDPLEKYLVSATLFMWKDVLNSKWSYGKFHSNSDIQKVVADKAVVVKKSSKMCYFILKNTPVHVNHYVRHYKGSRKKSYLFSGPATKALTPPPFPLELGSKNILQQIFRLKEPYFCQILQQTCQKTTTLPTVYTWVLICRLIKKTLE